MCMAYPHWLKQGKQVFSFSLPNWLKSNENDNIVITNLCKGVMSKEMLIRKWPNVVSI